jgi:hypothetical protein
MITDLCGILTLTLPNNYKPCCGNFIWTGHTVHNSMHNPWSPHVLVFQTKTFSCSSACKCSCLSNQNFLLQFRVKMFLSFKPKLSLAIQKIIVHERQRDRETDKQSMNWSKISSLHKTVVSCPDMYQQKGHSILSSYDKSVDAEIQSRSANTLQPKQTNKTKPPCIIKEYNQVPSPSPLHGLLLSLSLPFPRQKKISLLQPSQDKINK